MKLARIFVWLLLSTSVFAATPGKRIELFDLDETPDGYPLENPFSTMALFVSFTDPIPMHDGKPHPLGNVFQVLVDGGNGVQDPPHADGSPGGDDSLAYGNFNIFRINGLEDPNMVGKDSGLFFAHKYFIPFVLGRGYYLRLWEGKDVKTAPYYQDTKEYRTETDAGGGFYFFKEFAPPIDVEWKFTASKPRPQQAK